MVVSLCLLFEVLAVLKCIHALYGKMFNKDSKAVIFVIIEVLLIQFVRIMKIDDAYTMLMYGGVIVYCGIQFKWKIRELIINNIACIFIISIIQASLIILLSIIGKTESIGQKQIMFINIATFFLTALLTKVCNLTKVARILQKNEKIIVVTLFAIFVSMLFFIINYRNDKGINVIYYAVMILSVILIVATVIDIGKHKMKVNEMEAELRLHKLYESSFQSLIDDIRARQHEFDNHINVIYSQHYLYRTYEELVEVQKKYCKNIVAENSYNKLLSKGNSIVIGFLYSKFSEAERLGIHIDYKVQIGDMKSNVPMHKIIELLGNLLNNAMEALTGYEELNQMRVVILEQTHEIAINVSNECKNIEYEKMQNFFIKGYSEKGEKRGYGLYNVKKICEEYNIVMESVINQNEGIDWLNYMLIINKNAKGTESM